MKKFPAKVREIMTLDLAKDSKKGPVFIVASGSSARDFPIENFLEWPTIAMNGSISLFEKCNLKPSYYICSDISFPIEQPKLYSQGLECSETIVLAGLLAGANIPAANIIRLSKAKKTSYLRAFFKPEKSHIQNGKIQFGRQRSIGFSKNLNAGYFDARTVAYIAIQLAYHLGFNKVFLVGVDLNSGAGRFYEKSGQAVSPCNLDAALHKRILPSLRLISKSVVSERFQVYNLSAASKIPTSVFPKINLSELSDILAAESSYS
jgi:KDO transferase-3